MPDRRVDGSARLLVFTVGGVLKAKRDVPYLADGYWGIAGRGRGTNGPNGTLLFRIQSVNLDKEGRNESKSSILVIDANLKDVARIERFLDQTTFVDHALVFQDGFTLGQSRTYDVLDGARLSQEKHWHEEWPIDRKRSEIRGTRAGIYGVPTRAATERVCLDKNCLRGREAAMQDDRRK